MSESYHTQLAPLRTALLPVLLPAAIFLVLFVLVAPGNMIDDAFISFRYAKNIANGEGAVFNIGGERVEGFSNPLWTAFLAAGYKLGLGAETTARILQVLSALATFPLLWLCLREVLGPHARFHALALWCGVLLACNLSFLVYTHLGLETVFFALLVIAGAWRYLREEAAGGFPWSAVIVALAGFTRTEGFFLAAVVVAHVALNRFTGTGGGKYALRWLAVFALLYLPHFALRYWYFGELMPNTYIAKIRVGMQSEILRGLRYVRDFVFGYGRLISWTFDGFSPLRALVFIPAAGVLFALRDPKRRFLALIVAAYTAMTVLVGGDWMPYNRFFVHIIPVITVLIVCGASDFAALLPRAPRFLLPLAATLTIFGSVAVYHSPMNVNPWKAALWTVRHPGFIVEQLDRTLGRSPFWGRTVGQWMRGEYPHHYTFSTELAGAIPFYSGFNIVDTFGLVDKDIARILRTEGPAGVVRHALEQQPGLITLQMTIHGAELRYSSPIDREIFRAPECRRGYTLDAIHRFRMAKQDCDEMLIVFLRIRDTPLGPQSRGYDLPAIARHLRDSPRVYFHDNAYTPYGWR